MIPNFAGVRWDQEFEKNALETYSMCVKSTAMLYRRDSGALTHCGTKSQHTLIGRFNLFLVRDLYRVHQRKRCCRCSSRKEKEQSGSKPHGTARERGLARDTCIYDSQVYTDTRERWKATATSSTMIRCESKLTKWILSRRRVRERADST